MPVESHPTQCKTSHMAGTVHHPAMSPGPTPTKNPGTSRTCAMQQKQRIEPYWHEQVSSTTMQLKKPKQSKKKDDTVQPKTNARARTSFCVRKKKFFFRESLELESWKLQELLCGCMIKAQELLCSRIFEPQELLCGSLQWHFERNETGYA